MSKAHTVPPANARPRRPAPEKYSIEQAFNYLYGPPGNDALDALNDERALRAVAFLLIYCSQYGNESLDGDAANGLASILDMCAKRAARLERP